jgi:hypothetical protein
MTGALVLVLLALSGQQPSDRGSIVNASAVRLRATPSADGPVVTQLALGSEVTALERPAPGQWTRVRTSSGTEGWLSSPLVTDLGADRLATIERVIRDRLGRQGDGFPAAAELLAFVQRIAQDISDPETRARFAWHDLRATSLTAQAVPFITDRTLNTEPYASWLTARKDVVFYNEPAGAWMLHHSAFLDAYDRHRSTSAAGDILWESVLNGLGGECEGYVPCYVGMTNILEGEYLRREPRGRHAAKALARVADRLKSAVELSGDKDYFDPSKDCGDLRKAADPLRVIVEASAGADRDAAIASLDRLTARCAPANR